MSAATPAEIWWCDVRREEDRAAGRRTITCNMYPDVHAKCGPRLLVDPQALVVERDADGNWPDWAARAVSAFGEVDEDGAPTGRAFPSPDRLDALYRAAAASQDTE